MTVSKGQPTAAELKARLREKPLPELTEEMEELSRSPDCDVDLLRVYLDVLEEKAPILPADYDPETQYEEFRRTHDQLFESLRSEVPEVSKKKKGGLFRLKQVLVSFAAIFCLVIFVADANGAGVLDRLIEWGAETFTLRPASGVMELPIADENGFRSLEEALVFYEVEGAAIPTWIPARFSVDKITVLESNDMTIVSSKYTTDDGALYIRGTISSREDFTFEKNATSEYSLYTANGISFIVAANMEEEQAVWTTGGYVYSVGGDVTEKELKQILNSVQIKE